MSELIVLDCVSPITKDASGQLVTTSLVIAEGTEVQHKNVMSLVRKYKTDIEGFGELSLIMQKFQTAGGEQTREIAYLNEAQSSLIIAYMKNSEIVRIFKTALVKGFFDMRSQIENNFKLPTTYLEALQLLVVKEEEKILLTKNVTVLETKLTKQAPAVQFALAVRNLDGSCDVGEFAGIIGVGRNTLFKKMREDKLLMVNNRPYQRYKDSGIFIEIENAPYIDATGLSRPTFQTRITGKGQIFLEKQYRYLNPLHSFMQDEVEWKAA